MYLLIMSKILKNIDMNLSRILHSLCLSFKPVLDDIELYDIDTI